MKSPTPSEFPLRPLLSRQGFTLLEVLVAVMILAVAVTAILTQFSAGMEAGGKSRDITRAVLLAKEKLEDFKAFAGGGQEGQTGVSDDGYAWETRVSLYELPEKEAGENDNELSFELLKLTVIVRWNTGVRERQMELTTLKAVKKEDRT